MRRFVYQNTRVFITLTLTILLGLTTACFQREQIKAPGDPDLGVHVRWFGHSCFSFEDSAKRLFLVDPFDGSVGYPMPLVKPDVVLVTHPHFDHKYLHRPIQYEILTSTGVHTLAGIEIRGVKGFHDDKEGRRHGSTHFYAWEMGGMRMVHMGDVGQSALSELQQETLGSVDVLFIPVGGGTTVDAKTAAKLVKILKPRLVVPMHYGNNRVRFFEFDPVENFVSLFKKVVPLQQSHFQVRLADLPEETTIYVPAVP